MPTRGLVLNFPIDYQFIDPIMKESTNHDEFFSEDDSVMNEMINWWIRRKNLWQKEIILIIYY